jgi:outer membrane lipoprotein-sorting protein
MRFRISNFEFRTCSRLAAAIFIFHFSFFIASAADTDAPLASWLNAQTNIHSWSADFTQTRTLKSLTRPLTASGHVVFAAPNRFRWELGQPAQTIAVRGADEMLVIYPPMKRAERYPLNGSTPPQWRDMLSLLDAGFPHDKAQMDAQFKVISQTLTNGVCEITLQPKSPGARKLMPQMKIAFGTEDFSLRATELQFADGSTMRNDFINAVQNVKIDEASFTPKLDADYKISEPLKR